MLRQLAKLFGGVGLLVAVWMLGNVRTSWDGPWVRFPDSQSGRVRILRFQASVGTLTQGEKAQLCYGVENAKLVRISPVAMRLDPAPNRCLEIVPRHTTHYTILAEGFDGSVATRSFTLAVQAPLPEPAPLLQFAELIPN